MLSQAMVEHLNEQINLEFFFIQSILTNECLV